MWIRTDERLPPLGRWVLAHHTRGTWRDGADPEGVDHVVVQRRAYHPDDVRAPGFQWDMFGPDSFLAESIDRWMEIPRD